MSDIHVLAASKLSPLYASQVSDGFVLHDRLHEVDPVAFERIA